MLSFPKLTKKIFTLRSLNLFLFCYLTFRFLQQLIGGYSKSSYGVTEFLINYQAGFVRRGLWGEIIFQLSTFTNISPYYFILAISLISWIILIYLFLPKFNRSFLSEYKNTLLLSVIMFGNPVLNFFLIRKDAILLILFLLIIKLCRHIKISNILIINTLLIIGLLTHESIAFFTFPILFTLFKQHFSKHNNSIKSSLKSIIALLPSSIVFLIVIKFHGNTLMAKTIWDSWYNFHFPHIDTSIDPNAPQASIWALGWTTTFAMKLSVTRLLHQDVFFEGMAYLLIYFFIYCVLDNFIKKHSHLKPKLPVFGSILLIQFLSILPMLAIAVDYGRFIFHWVISSFILYLHLENIEKSIPNFIVKVDCILNFFKKHISEKTALLIGFPDNTWRIHYAIESSVFGNILVTINYIIKFVIKLIKSF